MLVYYCHCIKVPMSCYFMLNFVYKRRVTANYEDYILFISIFYIPSKRAIRIRSKSCRHNVGLHDATIFSVVKWKLRTAYVNYHLRSSLQWRQMNQEKPVRFQVLTAASIKFSVFWDIPPCCQIGVVWSPSI
jgi:hypothetical protein